MIRVVNYENFFYLFLSCYNFQNIRLKITNFYVFLKIDSYLHGQLTLEKRAKIIKSGKDNLFSKWCWENWIAICKRMKLDPDFTLYKKIHSKWIEDLSIRFKSVKVLKENIKGNL